MPTFLKDLSNFQLKLVWQNTALELLEASAIVFIGYSLPHADFELRQLLSRMLNKKASVYVVLWQKGRRSEYNAEKQRYEQFFAGRKVKVVGSGVKQFVDEMSARFG